jgi:tripartite-type tricarboxylate transporter receptor subunit TctC
VTSILRWCSLLCLLFGSAPSAYAQSTNYPDRPIRLVVAFSAGGATDVFARQIVDNLKEALGQPVIVENRPGAGGSIAWQHIAASEPDGYTLLLAENALAIAQGFNRGTAFDPSRQFDAVAHVATSPLVLVVSNKVQANSVAELVAASRSATQKISYSSSGVGSVAHLAFEVFKAGAGIEAVHVPYRGGGQSMADVVAGHIEAIMASIPVAKNLIASGQVKGLAVTSAQRSPVLPNVPTLKEAGVTTADIDLNFWWGIFGPAGMPQPVKAKLDSAISSVMANAAVRRRLANVDVEPAYAPGDALKAKLAKEITNWAKFIADHGIKPE